MCDVCGNSPEWLAAPMLETATPAKRREPKKMEGPEPPAKPTVAKRAEPEPSAADPAGLALLDLFKQWRRATVDNRGRHPYSYTN